MDFPSTYIGGTKMGGTWVWNWNTTKPIEFFNWDQYVTPQPNGDGNCIRLWNQAGYLWADGSCYNVNAYLCEIIL